MVVYFPPSSVTSAAIVTAAGNSGEAGSKTQSRSVKMRFLVLITVILVGLITSSLGYYLIWKEEFRAFENHFNSLAGTAADTVSQRSLHMRNVAKSLAVAIKYAYPERNQWPIVTYRGFRELSDLLTEISGFSSLHSLGLFPFVQSEDIQRFEQRAMETFASDPKLIPIDPDDEMLWKLHTYVTNSTTSTRTKVRDKEGITVDYDSPFRIAIPLTQSSLKNPAAALMYNHHSLADRGMVDDSIIECVSELSKQSADNSAVGSTDSIAINRADRCSGASDFAYFPHAATGLEDGINSGILQPIFAADDPHTVVGLAGALLSWQRVLTHKIFPEYIKGGFDVVVESSRGSFISYRCLGDQAVFKGKADIHDANFEKYRVTGHMFKDDSDVKYSTYYNIHFYPSKDFYQSHFTTLPLNTAMGAAVLQLIVYAIFFVYDVIMTEEASITQAVLGTKRRFVRFISHEVRTPLNAVELGLQVISNEYESLLQALVNALNTFEAGYTSSPVLDPAKSSGPACSRADPRSDPHPDPHTDLHSDSDPDPNSDPDSNPHSDPDSDPDSNPHSDPNSDPDSNPHSDPNSNPAFTAVTSTHPHASNSYQLSYLTATMTEVHNTLVGWRELMDDAMGNCGIAVVVLDDLLNYDKIEMGTLRLEFGLVHIWELINTVKANFNLRAKAKKVTIELANVSEPYESPDKVVSSACSSSSTAANTTTANLINLLDSSIGAVVAAINSGDAAAVATTTAECNWGLLTILGDTNRLGQVLRNLISNALKFTNEGGNVSVKAHLNPSGFLLEKTSPIPVPISSKSSIIPQQESQHSDSSKSKLLDGYIRAGSLVISVKDTGAGLSEDELVNLFGEGVQFNASKLQAGGGSGLGLFITKGLVEQHGGRIWAASEGLGKGTTFSIELPVFLPNTDSLSERQSGFDIGGEMVPSTDGGLLSDTVPSGGVEAAQSVPAAPAAPAAPTQQSEFVPTVRRNPDSFGSVASVDSFSSRSSGSGKKTSKLAAMFPNILIVDDAPSNRKLLNRLLTSSGFSCHEAVDGLDALRMYEKVTAQHQQETPHGGHSELQKQLLLERQPFGQSIGIAEITDKYAANEHDTYRGSNAGAAPIEEGGEDRDCTSSATEFFSIILMDYEMPEMDGPTATRELRTKLGCTCPIFGVTGNVLPQDVAHFKQQGANRVLAKPLTIAKLEETWMEYINASEEEGSRTTERISQG